MAYLIIGSRSPSGAGRDSKRPLAGAVSQANFSKRTTRGRRRTFLNLPGKQVSTKERAYSKQSKKAKTNQVSTKERPYSKQSKKGKTNQVSTKERAYSKQSKKGKTNQVSIKERPYSKQSKPSKEQTLCNYSYQTCVPLTFAQV